MFPDSPDFLPEYRKLSHLKNSFIKHGATFTVIGNVRHLKNKRESIWKSNPETSD